MDFSVKRQVAKNFAKDAKKNKYNMHHKLQRKEGQWNNLQKSELIDSMLRPYPIDPVRCEQKEDGIKYIFDGVQRSTTVKAYFNDEFKLSKKLNPVIIDNEVYEIAGKKYSELDDIVKEKLSDYEMTVYVFVDCTEEDIREMYRRQNNGKPLNNTQKRTAIETTKVSDIIFELADHNFFKKVLTPAQLKKDVQRDLVRETLMLIYTNDENDFTSFRAKDIDNFVCWYDQNINTADINILTDVMNKLDVGFEELKVKSTSIPMILYTGVLCIKQNKDFNNFIDAVFNFVQNYDTNEEYKQYVQAGTTTSAGVRSRLDYWNRIAESL